jgi:hypothetical protein
VAAVRLWRRARRSSGGSRLERAIINEPTLAWLAAFPELDMKAVTGIRPTGWQDAGPGTVAAHWPAAAIRLQPARSRRPARLKAGINGFPGHLAGVCRRCPAQHRNAWSCARSTGDL